MFASKVSAMKSTIIAKLIRLIFIGSSSSLFNAVQATTYEGDWWKTENDSDDLGGGNDDGDLGFGPAKVKKAKRRVKPK